MTIWDECPGSPPEERTRIWDRPYRGLGLGVSLDKAGVEAHGGRVEVESREVAGATFTVTLPAGT